MFTITELTQIGIGLAVLGGALYVGFQIGGAWMQLRRIAKSLEGMATDLERLAGCEREGELDVKIRKEGEY